MYWETNPKLSSEMKAVSRGGAETELFRAGGGCSSAKYSQTMPRGAERQGMAELME